METAIIWLKILYNLVFWFQEFASVSYSTFLSHLTFSWSHWNQIWLSVVVSFQVFWYHKEDVVTKQLKHILEWNIYVYMLYCRLTWLRLDIDLSSLQESSDRVCFIWDVGNMFRPWKLIWNDYTEIINQLMQLLIIEQISKRLLFDLI